MLVWWTISTFPRVAHTDVFHRPRGHEWALHERDICDSNSNNTTIVWGVTYECDRGWSARRDWCVQIMCQLSVCDDVPCNAQSCPLGRRNASVCATCGQVDIVHQTSILFQNFQRDMRVMHDDGHHASRMILLREYKERLLKTNAAWDFPSERYHWAIYDCYIS